MSTILSLLLLCLSLPWLFLCGATSSHQITERYVVYMGAPKLVEPSHGDIEGDYSQVAKLAHLQLLSSIVPSQESERISIIHNYNHAFRGFSAMLTKNEASLLSSHSEVVSVFPDKMLQLHTTRSWDFLGLSSDLQSISLASSNHNNNNNNNNNNNDEHFTRGNHDVIIGIIDSGIWPESPSFSGEGFGPIPSRWKGVCTEGPDFNKSNCNRKLIGARYYSSKPGSADSPRDPMGHGTHVASTAGGARVPNASYFGLARGTARGGSPSARIASYKACFLTDCYGSNLLQAIDDAVRDGVDVVSISVGFSSVEDESDYFSDPIAIGAFHAEQKGVMVICSAGNDGPQPYTVLNTAPWILTVAASTVDRAFQSAVRLGNGKVLEGFGINFSKLSRSANYPLVYAKDVAANSSIVSEARKCTPGSLDARKIAGKIIVCADSPKDPLKSRGRGRKRLYVEDAKSKGLIMIEEDEMIMPALTGIFSYVEVGKIAGYQILKYIKSTKKPTATILPTVEIQAHKPAPVVAVFSSRGPAQITENIIKPDIMAPGQSILAAIVPKTSEAIGNNKAPEFTFRSGTSMACPHVSGTAAFIKSVHSRWTSSIIKSALMTTATTYDNTRKPLTNSSKNIANPHEAGSGEINPIKALNPGLVFETTTQDYYLFLCYFGYSEKKIRSMIANKKFTCPKNPNKELISNINYPSISLGKLNRSQSQVIKRTVTNLGPSNSTYIAKVQSPKGLLVKVIPKKLVFTKGLKKASFRVLFDGKKAPSGYNFGAITWFDGRHSVRVVFTVNVE